MNRNPIEVGENLTRVRALMQAAREAAEGDSNDDEIGALSEAMEEADQFITWYFGEKEGIWAPEDEGYVQPEPDDSEFEVHEGPPDMSGSPGHR